jgi:LysW-gamma-L-lysine carboxypeptidase
MEIELSPSKPERLLYQMLKIYSPSGQEEELAFFLKNYLLERGFKRVRMDKEGNVLGEVGKGSPTVLLCGHMDTVPQFLPVRIEYDRIYGRGAVDAKSSLAAMIVAASRFLNRSIEGRILVAGVVDEEGQGKGIQQVLEDQLKIEHAIFGEPSGIRNVTVGYKGRIASLITLKTQSGHASVPQAFENAIEKAYDLWNKIKVSFKSGGKSPFYSTTASLTRIQGGEASNVIPHKCTMNIDLRFPPSINSQRILDLLNTHILKFKLENLNVETGMTIEDKTEAVIADKNSKLVKAISNSIENIVGGPVKYLKKTGTGDMNIFATRTDCPVATYGPGDSRMSHTMEEYIEIRDYHAAINILQETIIALLKNNDVS